MRSHQTSILILAFSAISCFANPPPDGLGTVSGSTQSASGTTQAGNNSSFQLASTWRTTLTGGDWNNTDTHLRFIADFDGDGLPDLMAFDPNNFYFARNTSTTFATPILLRDDFTTAQDWTSQNSTPRLFGDVNGDGKADLVAIGQSDVFVNISAGDDTTGTPSFDTNKFTASVGYNLQENTPRFVTDVNGDGRADLVGFYADGVYVSLSTGTAFLATTKWSSDFTLNSGWTSQDATPRMMADVNGDSLADIVGFGPKGVAVSVSNGTTFGPAKLVSQEFVGSAWPNNQTYPRFAADVNGDGLADFIGIDNGGVHVAIGTGAQPAEPSFIAYVGFEPSQAPWVDQMQTPRFVADVNGDKKADLLGFNATGMAVVLAP